jgi:hypothetical protein
LIVAGGGIGCEKYTTLLQGTKEDIELALERLRQMDPALYGRLRKMNVDFIIDEKTKQQSFVEKPKHAEFAPQAEDQTATFESTRALVARIECEKVNLERKLVPYSGGADMLNDYVAVLGRVLDSLLKPGLVDVHAWKQLRAWGDSFRNSMPNAFGPSERILGALERISARRIMEQ